MTSEEMLEILKQNTTVRTEQALDAIYAICIEQRERGLNDFTIATIAKLGFKRGVPRAQSLRNRTGEKYRLLIQSFIDEATPPAHSKEYKVNKSNSWIEEIDNPKLRLLVQILASELATAQSKIREFIPPGTRIEVYDNLGSTLDNEVKLTGQERRALEYIISEEFQKKWKFKATIYGEVMDQSNNIVLKPGTVDAIKKALSHL